MKWLRYFAQLGTGRRILWCYLIWYLVFVTLYFDTTHASLRLWLTSLGISVIVGVALVISTTTSGGGAGKLGAGPRSVCF